MVEIVVCVLLFSILDMGGDNDIISFKNDIPSTPHLNVIAIIVCIQQRIDTELSLLN